VPYKDAAKDRAAHAARNRRLWAATPQWKRTEGLVAVMLRRRGVQCRRVGKVRSPFDVLTAGGLRCEVKAASFRRNRKAWVVSIQRQGKLDESQVDFYVLALSVGGLFHRAKHKKVYLVIESPIRRKQIVVTLHRLLTQWKDYVGAWSLIQQAERRTKRA
jgi:hypothetical protein